MINIKEVDWSQPGVKLNRLENNVEGKPLAFVIETEVAATIPVDKWFADLLLSIDTFTESTEYPEKNGMYVVNLIKDNNIVEQLICDELIYSVLLSEPKIIHLCEDYENSRMVVPGWHFAENKFYIPDQSYYV
jgi:hypothetical protein